MSNIETEPGDTPHEDRHDPGRRRLITGIALGGAGLVGGLVGGATAAATTSSKGDSSRTLAIDVACLGDTWRMMIFENEEDPGDLRGSTFNVEGLIFPAGTIPDGNGFVPLRQEAIGHWFCRGSFLLHGGRPEPHVNTNQEYVFGLIDHDHLFHPDMICTTGLEGSNENFVRMPRAITGGTGNYRSARGECTQYFVGENSTVFADDPTVNAPNIRFEFDLDLPS